MSANNTETLILVVEDSVVTSVAVERVIEHALKGCRIIRAQSFFEAQLLLSIYNFDLFVIDVHLPDGCGLDLLCPIVEKNPNAPALVLTADDSPEHRDRSKAFGVQHYITKPFRPETLTRAVQDCVSDIDALRKDSMFAVSLKRLSVLDVVQLKCLNRASTRLEICPKGDVFRVGTIDLQQGQIINAEVRDETHTILSEGHAAISEILGWRKGVIEEVEPVTPAKHTIEESWESLLLSTVKDADEQAHEELSLQN